MTRIVLIGARRRRQGIGEFVARSFAEAGADVRAVVGTQPQTATRAAETLGERYGIECRPYTSLREALERETPDVVAICSPFVHHAAHLEETATAGLNCLCEKPMWWPEGTRRAGELAHATSRLVDGFGRRGRLLELITQWPYTLGAFYEIYPERRDRKVERFEMRLSPLTADALAVLDSMPHVLSMLQALVGCGHVIAPVARTVDPRELTVSFEYKYDTETSRAPGTVAVRCRFTTCDERPRPASYALDGHSVERLIAVPDYSMSFRGSGRTVSLEDPLGQLVRAFLQRVSMKAETQRQELVESMTGLETLFEAVKGLEQQIPER